MKQRPIIFSVPMVSAIHVGKKTQTRRVMKVQPRGAGGWVLHNSKWMFPNVCPHTIIKCPYGIVGDQLWGKEPWRIGAWNEHGQVIIEYRDGSRSDWLSDPTDVDGEKFNNIVMQCSDELSRKGIQPDADGQYHWPDGESPLRWRSSMFMPRWASRILLEITNIRVERVQDISEHDAFAEGVEVCDFERGLCAEEEYSVLWTQIHGYDDQKGWSANPWVWVVEFKRVGGGE